jgi:hypothetical protein
MECDYRFLSVEAVRMKNSDFFFHFEFVVLNDLVFWGVSHELRTAVHDYEFNRASELSASARPIPPQRFERL